MITTCHASARVRTPCRPGLLRLLCLVQMVCAMTWAGPAIAATCNLATTGVALGVYTPNQAAPADSAASVSITCAKGALDILPLTVAYSVEISTGNSSTYSPREMTSGRNALRYNLYRDALRNSIWGDTTGGTANVTGSLQLQTSPGTASAVHTIYGRIFSSQNATPGVYADTIVITISY